MKIARVTGSVTATLKADELGSLALLVVDVEDAVGNVLQPALVVADRLGAGRGDLLLVTTGSSARLPAGVAGLAIDAVSVAIIDEISIALSTDSGAPQPTRRTNPEDSGAPQPARRTNPEDSGAPQPARRTNPKARK